MGNICSCTSEKAKTKKNTDKAGHGSGKMDQEDTLCSKINYLQKSTPGKTEYAMKTVA